MGEENGMGKEEMRMGEMEGGRAMEVEMARENFYPLPLYSHEDVVKDRALFMDSMRRFHHSMGTKLSIPVLGGKEIDLHLLYKEVTQRGGLEKVILEKKLREVVMAFSFPPTTTSASFVLRNHYLSLLHHYEQVYFFGAQGPPVPPAASFDFCGWEEGGAEGEGMAAEDGGGFFFLHGDPLHASDDRRVLGGGDADDASELLEAKRAPISETMKVARS
ncbi:high mobility group B protein 9-like [Elaeis guineensis]|uniref:high mobility group B protein 9-like n=1 Tax=Elaeis guineensis var. tenera TaxID=51953 RepID=UPI003C6CEDB6